MKPRPLAARLRRVLPLAVAAAVGTGAGAGAYALSEHSSSAQSASNTPVVTVPAQSASSTSSTSALTEIYKEDAPGVVDITVTARSAGSNPFGVPQPKEQAEGSGFVIDTKGDIVTAAHVVAGATSIKVHFADGSTTTGTLLGSDPSTDTAVVNVDVAASKLHPLALGDSSTVQPGQAVVAFGSPFGLAGTMTSGIVSAINRDITAPNNFSISGAIQTDAAINHGNSGGPLVDVATNTVVGVNDQIESDTNDNAGVGFAGPIDSSNIQTLVAGGTVRHAYMGVRISSNPGGGAKVGVVEKGSPAARAGLKVGDVITAFGGTRVLDASSLTEAVTASRPGRTVPLTVRRGGVTKHVTITLGTQPASAS